MKANYILDIDLKGRRREINGRYTRGGARSVRGAQANERSEGCSMCKKT